MVSAKFDIKKESFDILEERGRDRTAIAKMKPEEIKSQYWDARIFGCTFLEQGSRHINTGVVHFPVGRSVSPVDIQRLTLTNKSGVQEDKDQGMAPMAFRVVSHGVYVVPFHVNPVQAHKTGCTPKDIEVMLALLPYVLFGTRITTPLSGLYSSYLVRGTQESSRFMPRTFNSKFFVACKKRKCDGSFT